MNVFNMKNMAMVITSKINEFLKVIMAMFIIAFKTFALGMIHISIPPTHQPNAICLLVTNHL
jgi:hypothetical protein